MSSKVGLGLPAKIPSNKDYENLVDLNYQLYNGLFLTLPLDEIEQTGMLLPLLEARAQKGLSQGDEPAGPAGGACAGVAILARAGWPQERDRAGPR